MKKLVKFTVAMVLLAIFANCEQQEEAKTGDNNNISVLSADSVSTPKVAPAPAAKVPVAEKPRYFIRAHENLGMDSSGLVKKLKLDANPYTAIEAIGWSKTGLFAYRYRYLVDSGEGESWIYSFVILNTVDNEIIEKDSIGVDVNAPPAVTQIYRGLSGEYKAKWSALLGKHGISGNIGDLIADKFKNDLLGFPISDSYCWFDYSIRRTIFHDKDMGMGFAVDSVKWKLAIGNDVAHKTIAENIEERRGMLANVSGRKILGYYKSPYENKIVVALSNYYWFSLSGGYYTIGLDVFGSDLDVE